MDVELWYIDGCPSWQVADERLAVLADELGFAYATRLVRTPAEAEAIGFCGSPSIIVDGVDAFASGHEPVGLSCRIYQTPDGPAGSPTVQQLREVLG